MAGLDDIFVVVVGRHLVARGGSQILEHLLAFEYLAGGERTEPVEVDDALLSAAWALVAFWPFADVAVETYGGEVAAGVQIHRVAIGDEVGEGQVAGIGVIHQFAEAHRECAYLCGHEDIGAAGSLHAALQCAVVHGAHLVGVVAEVGGRAGVVEREHTSDEQ